VATGRWFNLCDKCSRTPYRRTSDLFNSGQKLGGLQPLSFQGAGY
jgi:hypothetical protein